tara:strand:+ start:30 stop:1367 length:1338 start_codon:yes stop_codon:yes gene_type:complete
MANTYITRTPSSAGNRKKYTLSFWMKRSSVSTAGYFFHCAAGESNPQTAIEMNTDGTLSFWDSTAIMVTPVASLRDPSAWYHIVIAVDTTQSESSRVKFYINGVQQTTFSTASGKTIVYPSADYEGAINTTVKHTIGAYNNTSGHYSGLVSHFHFCDGTQLAPTVFGETDSTTGEWKIKTSPSFTLGTNGFTILKDGNTITDQSSNSNDFSLGGGTLTKTEDSPSNVFATLNPLVAQGDTFANGNNTYTRSGSGWRGSYSTIGLPSTGKFYCEFKISSGSNLADLRAGIADDKLDGCIDLQNRGQVNQIGVPTNSISYTASNGNADINNSTTSSYGAAISTSNVLGMAIDMTNMKLYYSKDGSWQNSGNPESGATGTGALSIPATTGTYFVGVGVNTSGWYVNFGNGTFGTAAISSEGTNASGIGKFEYDVPAGYTALSTKGLNE